MNMQLWKEELEIFEKEADMENDCEIFNYAETLAGHTLIIGNEYELVKSDDILNVYTIKRKDA